MVSFSQEASFAVLLATTFPCVPRRQGTRWLRKNLRVGRAKLVSVPDLGAKTGAGLCQHPDLSVSQKLCGSDTKTFFLYEGDTNTQMKRGLLYILPPDILAIPFPPHTSEEAVATVNHDMPAVMHMYALLSISSPQFSVLWSRDRFLTYS